MCIRDSAYDGQLRKSRHLREPALDLQRFALQNVQVRAIDFYRERTLKSRQRFVDRVFGGLSVIEDNSRK